jgi:hypothetical protein
MSETHGRDTPNAMPRHSRLRLGRQGCQGLSIKNKRYYQWCGSLRPLRTFLLSPNPAIPDIPAAPLRALDAPTRMFNGMETGN